ncbi:MAG: T9SS type A sorting domain-containing protein [Brevinematales bacterium]|nr:T9SS type A sorting domain-containing protein [Brevinematales bacterium]
MKVIFIVVIFLLVLNQGYPFKMTNNVLNIDFSPATTNLIYDIVNASILQPPNNSILLNGGTSSFKITNITIDKSKMENFSTLFISTLLTPSTTVEVHIMNGKSRTILETIYLTSSQGSYFIDLKKILPKDLDNIYFIFTSLTTSPIGGKILLISLVKEVAIENYVEDYQIKAYPNPVLVNSNNRMKFSFKLPKLSTVSVVIFDSIGNIIKTIYRNNNLESGVHIVEWDLKDDTGKDVPSGKYIVLLKADNNQSSFKFNIIR